MRIGLDARTIFARQRRGIGRSLLRLYQTLAEARPDWQIVAYHRDPDANGDLLPGAELRYIEMRGDRFDAWLQFRLPIAARVDRLDVMHCPANQCPRWMPVPTIVTIHDLIPLDSSESFDAPYVRRFSKWIAHATRNADAITCPSQYTRARLVEEMGGDARRIRATPWGADVPANPSNGEAARDRHRVNKPYALHFGSDELRKNTRSVIEAWALMRRSARQDTALVVLGLSAEAQGQFMTLSQKLGVAKSVILSGFADEADAAALLRGAKMLVYPSRSEGFGLPLLEAFAAGTPVLTSDRTALPEVAGDAALLVDPTDPVAMSKAMGKLLRDSTLRRTLTDRGYQRAQQFTWLNCAERFAAVVERLTGTIPLRKAA